MFITTIIPTVGRSTVDLAVMSVLDQVIHGVTSEIIVVNDSGNPLPYAAWMDCERVRVIDTNHNERSVARNTGAAFARGKYLHFLDDDDWILPDTYARFWQLGKKTKASFLYGGSRLCEDKNTVIYEINLKHKGNCFAHMMAGEWIPTGSYLVKREVFFKVGGFTPGMSVYEDFDFARRAALETDFDFIEDAVLCIMRGNAWDTTTPLQRGTLLIREISLRARERILSHPDAYRRCLQSAKNNYWRGHVLRTYISSLIWNMKVKSYSLLVARLTQIIALLIISGLHLFRPDYWEGVTKPHSSTIHKTAQVQNHM